MVGTLGPNTNKGLGFWVTNSPPQPPPLVAAVEEAGYATAAYADLGYASSRVVAPVSTGSVVFAGSGGFNVTTLWTANALFAGTGFLGADSSVISGAGIQNGSALFNGAGGLTVNPYVLATTSALFGGVGALNANAMKSAGLISLGGVGGLNVSGTVRAATSALFGGTGLLAAQTVLTAKALFGGTGALNVSVAVRMAASANFSGAGALNGSAGEAEAAAALFGGTGGLGADATQITITPAGAIATDPIASVSIAGEDVVNPLVGQQANALFGGAGGLTASYYVVKNVTITFPAQGAGSLSANLIQKQGGVADATGGLVARTTLRAAGRALLGGQGGLSVNATSSGANRQLGGAILAGAAGLTVPDADISVRVTTGATFGGQGGLSVTALSTRVMRKMDVTVSLAQYGGDVFFSSYSGSGEASQDDGDVFIRTAA